MNILFVCKWNRFRSNSAESIFNYLNKSKEHEARSGGFFPGVPVSDDIVEAGERIGVRISKKQQGLTHKLLMWSDVIIIVADDVPKSMFWQMKENDGKRIVKWKIKDVFGTSVEKRKKGLEEIKRKVERLLREIG